MNPTPPPADERVEMNPGALLAALVLPGLGHVVRGERTRGLLAFSGVMLLFLTGLVAGGIDVVDRREDKFWFIGQACVGPVAFGVDWYHQNRLKVVDPNPKPPVVVGRSAVRSAYPTEGRDPKTGRPVAGGRPPNIKSIGKVNEIGMLACTLAGMLNVIVILDAGFPNRRRVRENG